MSPIVRRFSAQEDEVVEIQWNFNHGKPRQFTRHSAPLVVDAEVKAKTALTAEDVMEEIKGHNEAERSEAV